MLMALMGKVGNMQEQINNAKRKTNKKKTRENTSFNFWELITSVVEPSIPILYAMINFGDGNFLKGKPSKTISLNK